jgi:hypothetical protein
VCVRVFIMVNAHTCILYCVSKKYSDENDYEPMYGRQRIIFNSYN